MSRKKWFIAAGAIAISVVAVLTVTMFGSTGALTGEKPVIYLYPEKETDVRVNLLFDGELTCSYPKYQNGWQVKAFPNGRLVNRADGKEYSYLFWEGTANFEPDFSKGFVVPGSDTEAFLRDKLSLMGLTPNEYNDFIVFWLPQMQDSPYNLISFQEEHYQKVAKLEISPLPDSMLRIFMAYKPLSEKTTVEEQNLKPFQRKGFTVVEWGGCEVR